jgi:hypothetical protein
MTTQSETIIWHKYPEETPPIGVPLFVQYRICGKGTEHFDMDIKTWNGAFLDYPRVIAWAEMPTGWKEN